jgi:hypothetical protein
MSMLDEKGKTGRAVPPPSSSAILTLLHHMSLSGEEGVSDEEPASRVSDAAKHHRINKRTMLF